MEGIKEKGFFRRFLKWLSTPEEEEIVDGELNIKAFEEDEEIVKALNEQAKKTESMGKRMFSKAEERKATVNSLKYNVNGKGTAKKQIKGKQKQESDEERAF